MRSIDNQEHLEGFLDIIYIISDKEYQIRVWIRAEGPEVQDYDNLVNDFFDVSVDIFKNYPNYYLTTIQYTLLKRFRDQFRLFVRDVDNHYDPEEFIDSPEWEEMIKKAKEVLKTFNYQKPTNSD